jgi:hypothetical protein
MKKLDHKRLAEGEVTGHYHEATARTAELFDHDGQIVLNAPHGTTVKHQEHKPLKVPPGEYDRLIVQEYDPFGDEVRSVRD